MRFSKLHTSGIVYNDEGLVLAERRTPSIDSVEPAVSVFASCFTIRFDVVIKTWSILARLCATSAITSADESTLHVDEHMNSKTAISVFLQITKCLSCRSDSEWSVFSVIKSTILNQGWPHHLHSLHRCFRTQPRASCLTSRQGKPQDRRSTPHLDQPQRFDCSNNYSSTRAQLQLNYSLE